MKDDISIGNLIVTTTETQNYQYHLVTTGRTALMDALLHRPDIMLLDLGLPDMEKISI